MGFRQLPTDATTTNQSVELDSVSCASAGNCAAVGSYSASAGGGGLLLTETDGTWSRGVKATLPADAAALPVSLVSVSCPSAGNCTAVGSYSTSAGGGTGALVVTETAGSWAPGVEVIQPANSANQNARLASVSCPSVGNCSAVGTYTDDSRSIQGLLVSETDGVWSPGVEAVLPANADPTYVDLPDVELNSVSCASAGNCSAGGNYTDSSTSPQALLLNETAGHWATGIEAQPASYSVDAHILGPPSVRSVSCFSPGSCSAVATHFGSSGNPLGLLLTEAAGTWATGKMTVLPANAASDPMAGLASVSCAPSGQCSAGGSYTYGGTPCQYCGHGGLLVGGSPATVKLRVSKNGTGAGRVSTAPRGIGCGSTCSASFHAGTALTLTATAAAGSQFSGWSGAGCQGHRSCKVTTGISRQTVKATFTLLPKCVVPNLKDAPLNAAKHTLRTHNCTTGTITRATSQTIKQGHVISQTPKPGKRLHNGARVNLVVSKGRR